MKNMTSFPWQVLQINNILVTFSLLSIYTSKFLTWQFFLVKEKLARQIFLDKENLSTIPHLHEQFFLVKENLSRKNCWCKWGLKPHLHEQYWQISIIWHFPPKRHYINYPKRHLSFVPTVEASIQLMRKKFKWVRQMLPSQFATPCILPTPS